MKDIPIIFSATMVRALLDGRKTMSRRLAWGSGRPMPKQLPHAHLVINQVFHPATPWQRVKIGDRLWVRETWAHDAENIEACRAAYQDFFAAIGTGPYYRVGEVASDTLKWISPIHMPRWASRLTLIVTATKIERLDAITEADAKAEGAIYHDGHGVGHSGWRHDPDHGYVHRDARTSFACLWDRLHGEGSFNACNEVVALTFTVHKQNIDTLPKAEAA